MKVYPLRIFVQRVLLLRLAAATAAIAVLVGAAGYAVQRQGIARQVLDIGRQAAEMLAIKVMALVADQGIPPDVALHRVLAAAARSPGETRAGRFVFAQFHDLAGRLVAEAEAPDAPTAAVARAALGSRPFDPAAAEREAVRMERTPEGLLVLCTVPLADDRGAVRGFARAGFKLSEEAEAELRAGVLRSALTAAGIACVIAAMLYPVILRLTRRLADYAASLLDANLETLAVLGSAVAKRDADTDEHNYRVSLYAARLGEKIGLPAEEMRGLIKGAFIHDVGKIGIPDGILHKPGRLDEQEFKVMQTHVGLGVDIVRRAAWLRDSVPVVEGHHEKFGGGGYPRGIRAEAIPLTARIFAIADVFDALTSARPYKAPLPLAEALGILEEGRGAHFDPRLLDAFAGIAADCHAEVSGRDPESLRQALVAVVARYFSAEAETLSYAA
jgi:HD-GYP domain-containing protein (c-di-GMP phosphodiesterase class II)